MGKEMSEATRHAIDFCATGGKTIQYLLASPEAMSALDNIVHEGSGFTLGDHVRCCVVELNAFELAEAQLRHHNKRS